MKNLYLLLLLIIPSVLYCQSINLYNINSENFPLIEAEFFITDVDGSQVVNVTTDEFSITEQQREKIINEITCSTDSVINNISTVLTLDVSSSMRGAKFDWIKEASSVWITQMDSTREETAITTFDDEAILYSDFNINRETLLDVVQTLELRDGTNFRTAFLDPYAGALDVARRADYQPIIVFLTDGVGTTEFNVGEVVSLAKSMNAIVYAISLEITLPDEIKQVTDATGGLYFEEIDSKNKLIEVYNTIKKIAVSTSPCKISWFTDGCLLGKESKIEYKPSGVSKEFKFDKPGFEPPQFEFINGEFALFDCNVPNVFTMRLRALNSNIEVSSIDKVSGINACSQFEAKVIGKQFPFVLEKDSVMELEIEYLGTNAEYNFCQFTINSSTCLNVDFYTVSNCLNSPPQNNVLNVVEPNGGEVIKSGSKQKIFWKGTLKEKTKIIEYSTNSGISWNLVNSGKLDRSIEWNTPNVESNECLVRVQQMSEMAGRKLYSLNIDSLDVNKISWNNAGNVFAILSESGKIYLVNSVIGQIANVFNLGSNGDGDLNFLPDGVRLLYSSSSGTQLINLITQDVTNISSFGGEIEFSFRSDVGVIYNENEVRILDLKTLSFVNQFDLPFGATQITDAAISKSSNSIVISTATQSKSDSLYILDKRDTWDSFDVRTIIDDLFKFSYQFVEWSQDENFIISTSKIGDEKWLEIWNVSTGIKLEKLFRPTFSEIRDLSASYYDDYVVLVDRGFNVIVWEWDISNENIFNKKYEFKSESIVNNDIEWSKDGTRFAVGQTGTIQDSLLTVFSVKSYPELLDISDSTFSLVKNTIIAKDVDMGNVLITSSKDSTLNSLLDYSYTFEIEIDSIEITGIDRNSFSISNSPNLPTQISDTKQPDFIIEFSPSKQGAHNALAMIYSKYGISEFRLLGNGVQPIIGKNDISFGEVNVGSEKLITQTSLVNNGTSTLTINSIEIISPSKDQFKLFDQSNEVSQINDIELDSEEEYGLTASFAPTNDLLYNSRIRVIFINEFNNTDTLNIRIDGRGIKPLLEYYEYNFGIVQCDESIEDSITIYNNGSGVLKISEIELNKINFEFLDNSLEFIDILENDSARIGIRFRPIDYGIIKDSIVFISNSYKDSVKVMYLNGRRLNTSFEVIGNTNFVGIDDNTVINEEFDIENDGRTNLVWNTPMVSNDGRIVINSINPNPTLPGESSTVSVTINSGDKGEIYRYKFSPSPICSDSIELNAEVKSTSPTLYYSTKDEYRIVCDDEYTISIPINNIGEAQLTIDSLKLSELNNSFEINDNSFSLSPNQMDTIDITFKNSTPGTYQIVLHLYSNDSKSNDGITSIPITIIKEISDFEIIENDVTFDYLNNNNPGTRVVNVKNNGTVPIRWDLDLSSDYTILSVEPPIAGVGDTSVIKLIYTGNKEIFATDKFIVRDSCETEKQIDINILGKGSETINISLSNERRNIGEKFNLKLFFSSSKSFNDGEVLKGNLEFNRTLMRPNNSNSVTEGGIRKVPFEIENINSNFEYEIAMEALWGNDSCTNVSLTDLTMLNANVNIDYSTQGGSLCIEDLCYADGVRLLKFNFENQNEIKIENNQDGVILVNINTIEKSDIEILLYDFYGRIINIENFPSSDNNEYRLFVGEINSGSYFIQVKTYSQTFNKKLLIVN